MEYAPSEFWKITLSEFHWLVKGRNKSNAPQAASTPDAPTIEEMNALKRKFPD